MFRETFRIHFVIYVFIIGLFIYLSIYLFIIYLFIYSLSIYLFIYYLFIHLFIYLVFIYLFIWWCNMFQFDNPWWPATIKHSHIGESKRPNDEWTPNSWVRNAQIIIKTGKLKINKRLSGHTSQEIVWISLYVTR